MDTSPMEDRGKVSGNSLPRLLPSGWGWCGGWPSDLPRIAGQSNPAWSTLLNNASSTASGGGRRSGRPASPVAARPAPPLVGW